MAPIIEDDVTRFSRLCANQRLRAAQVLGRPINRSEETAVEEKLKMEYCFENIGITFGYAAGLGFGLWRAYNTRHNWRFPFMKPPKNFNPNVIRIRPTSRIITGENARKLWSFLRLTSYGVATGMTGYALGAIASKSIAALTGAVMMKYDPRLREFSEALQKHRNRGDGSRLCLARLEAYNLHFLENIRKLDLQPLWWPIYVFFLRTD